MKMNKKEIYEMAETMEIITRLISENKILSLTKIIFLTFSIKNMKIFFSPTNKKFGLINEVYQSISYGFQSNFKDFTFIFKSLDILKDGNYIEIQENKVNILRKFHCSRENTIMNSQSFKKIIGEIMKLSDLSFIKGVIDNV